MEEYRLWDEQQVGAWLSENGFGHYQKLFIGRAVVRRCRRTDRRVDNDINGDILAELTYSLLKELGVQTVGDRVRIMTILKNLKRKPINAKKTPPGKVVKSFILMNKMIKNSLLLLLLLPPCNNYNIFHLVLTTTP